MLHGGPSHLSPPTLKMFLIVFLMFMLTYFLPILICNSPAKYQSKWENFLQWDFHKELCTSDQGFYMKINILSCCFSCNAITVVMLF